MPARAATVTWELVTPDDIDEETPPEGMRVVVDVDAPMRPFGAAATPPRGTRKETAVLPRTRTPLPTLTRSRDGDPA